MLKCLKTFKADLMWSIPSLCRIYFIRVLFTAFISHPWLAYMPLLLTKQENYNLESGLMPCQQTYTKIILYAYIPFVGFVIWVKEIYCSSDSITHWKQNRVRRNISRFQSAMLADKTSTSLINQWELYRIVYSFTVFGV